MPTNQIDELQRTLDHIRQRKAARRVLAGPTNRAPDPSTAPTIEARIAKLRSLTAGAKDDLARIAAKTAAAALSPRDQRRSAAKGTLADQSDSQLQFVASHRSAPAEDAAAARAELQARGWTVHPNGAFTRSTVKEPRR